MLNDAEFARGMKEFEDKFFYEPEFLSDEEIKEQMELKEIYAEQEAERYMEKMWLERE